MLTVFISWIKTVFFAIIFLQFDRQPWFSMSSLCYFLWKTKIKTEARLRVQPHKSEGKDYELFLLREFWTVSRRETLAHWTLCCISSWWNKTACSYISFDFRDIIQDRLLSSTDIFFDDPFFYKIGIVFNQDLYVCPAGP